jgi:hypothetical protein
MVKINLVYHFGFDNLIATNWRTKKILMKLTMIINMTNLTNDIHNSNVTIIVQGRWNHTTMNFYRIHNDNFLLD